MTRTCTPAALALTFLLSGPAPAADDKDDAVKKELKQFQGKWLTDQAWQDGKWIAGKDDSVVFEDDRVQFFWMGANKGDSARVTALDPTKDPKEIDISYDGGPAVRGKARLGIYRFQDGRLEISWGDAGAMKRPTTFGGEFEVGAGKPYVVLKREKKDGDKPTEAEEAFAKALKPLEGKWVYDQGQKDGKRTGHDGDGMFIEDDKVRFLYQGDKQGATARVLSIDATKDPKEIDVVYLSGQLERNQRRLGVYRMKNDKLEIVWGELGDKKRPAKFSGDKEEGAGTDLTYKKDK